jgi:hypothetical protein
LFCSDRRQSPKECSVLTEDNTKVLSFVRTEHSFGIVFCQNRTFLWWFSSVRT